MAPLPLPLPPPVPGRSGLVRVRAAVDQTISDGRDVVGLLSSILADTGPVCVTSFHLNGVPQYRTYSGASNGAVRVMQPAAGGGSKTYTLSSAQGTLEQWQRLDRDLPEIIDQLNLRAPGAETLQRVAEAVRSGRELGE
jgi:hypothetical protein